MYMTVNREMGLLQALSLLSAGGRGWSEGKEEERDIKRPVAWGKVQGAVSRLFEGSQIARQTWSRFFIPIHYLFIYLFIQFSCCHLCGTGVIDLAIYRRISDYFGQENDHSILSSGFIARQTHPVKAHYIQAIINIPCGRPSPYSSSRPSV